MTHKLLFFTTLLLVGVACSTSKQAVATPVNPPASGFNSKDSDAQAIAIADAVMVAQGGRAAWDETHFISWTFFGSRTLVWDKYSGDVRIESLKRPLKIIVNINAGTGKVWLNGQEQFQQDTLSKYLKMGKEIWINDSYWLVMPYKLKDSGVTLKYLGVSKTEAGEAADLLQLTFQGVGVTPDNKYHVWVDSKTHLVSQWAFFEKFADEKARFTNAWKDYKKCGAILLSCDRGRKEVNLCPVEVSDAVPANVFK